MQVIIRDYKPEDAPAIIAVFRNSFNSLRKSRGGSYPDDYVDRTIGRPDRQILSRLGYGNIMVVAELKKTGEIIGMDSIANRWKHSLLKSTYNANNYVKERYQKGRAGVRVGSMLKKATIEKAKSLGFRKMYGYSTPEARGLCKKFGARFFPSHNAKEQNVEFHYYEIELCKSFWNSIRIEPYFAELSQMAKLYSSLRKMLGF